VTPSPGKTNFLRVLARRIVEAYSPSSPDLLVDYRADCSARSPRTHLIGYGTNL